MPDVPSADSSTTSDSGASALCAIGLILLSLGSLLLAVPGRQTWAIPLITLSVPALIAAGVIGVRSPTVRWGQIIVALFLVATSGPWWFFMGRQMFGRPWKKPTSGYAELHNVSLGWKLHMDLPAGWVAQYRGRNRHEPHEAYLIDGVGRRRFDLYGGVYDPGKPPHSVEEIADSTIASWSKLSEQDTETVKFVDSEFREAATGKVWLARYYYPDGAGYGGREWQQMPVVCSAYHGKVAGQLVLVEFHMRKDEAEDLEPLSWKLFQSVRLK